MGAPLDLGGTHQAATLSTKTAICSCNLLLQAPMVTLSLRAGFKE